MQVVIINDSVFVLVKELVGVVQESNNILNEENARIITV
jgi:hypothetical protein